MKEIIVGSNEAGQRLDKLLKKYLKEASGGFLYRMMRKKNITLNSKKAEGKELLKVGDKIQIFFSQETLEKFTGSKCETAPVHQEEPGHTYSLKKIQDYKDAFELWKNITILFENEHFLLVNKPRGILSQKAEKEDLSLNEWLIGYLLNTNKITTNQLETFRPSICNRLDRNTSGLVICSKSYVGSKQINQWIKERKIKKYYRCFLAGDLTQPLQLTGYLEKNTSANMVKISNQYKKDASLIQTNVTPLFQGKGISYAEVELITGKTHQIRAHLSSVGHPLLGDKKYGKEDISSYFNSFLPKGQLLHSYRIIFPETDFCPEISNKEFVASEPGYFLRLKDEIITDSKGV